MVKLRYLLFLMIPSFAFAQFTETKKPSIEAILAGIENYLLGFVGAIAVLFIVIGGVRYITSSGNPDQVSGARKTIAYAIFGLLVVLLYKVVRVLLEGLASFAN